MSKTQLFAASSTAVSSTRGHSYPRGFIISLHIAFGGSGPAGMATPTAVRRHYCAATKFETLDVSSPSRYVVKVQLNRPEKSNAMNRAFWRCEINVYVCIVSPLKLSQLQGRRGLVTKSVASNQIRDFEFIV